MTSFALPGTVAESKLQWKSQRESSFNRSNIQKTSLATWDLNTSISSLPNQSSTMFAHGMPTPQTPLTTLNPLFDDLFFHLFCLLCDQDTSYYPLSAATSSFSHLVVSNSAKSSYTT